MKHDPGEPRLPDVVLERFRLNELPADLPCLVEARIASDEHLQQRLNALRRSDDDIRVSYPGERFAETIRTRLGGRERARSPAPRRAAMYWIVPLTVAAATVALVLVTARTSPPLPGFGHTYGADRYGSDQRTGTGTQGVPKNEHEHRNARRWRFRT